MLLGLAPIIPNTRPTIPAGSARYVQQHERNIPTAPSTSDAIAKPSEDCLGAG